MTNTDDSEESDEMVLLRYSQLSDFRRDVILTTLTTVLGCLLGALAGVVCCTNLNQLLKLVSMYIL